MAPRLPCSGRIRLALSPASTKAGMASGCADTELCKKYEAAVSATSVLLTFDANAAKIYARLRCDRSLRAPDAIQLACAAATGVDLFITNDARLQGKQVTGIHFIVPLDRVPV